MTEEELERFMAQARKSGPKYSLLFAMTYYFAMRVSEVTSLTLADFNPPSHQITIRGKKAGKKAGRVRTYDLPEQIELKYRRWLKYRDSAENPYVFPSRTLPRSGHMSRDTAQLAFRVLCRKSGVAMPRSIHDLRHTKAQQLIRGQENLATVKGMLRHRDIQSTKVYIDDELSHDQQQRMAQREARFL
jgi:integrase